MVFSDKKVLEKTAHSKTDRLSGQRRTLELLKSNFPVLGLTNKILLARLIGSRIFKTSAKKTELLSHNKNADNL